MPIFPNWGEWNVVAHNYDEYKVVAPGFRG